MTNSFLDTLYRSHQESPKTATQERVIAFVQHILGVLFPELSKNSFTSKSDLEFHLVNLKEELYEILYMYPNRESLNAGNKADQFFEELPHVYKKLRKDITAIYDGDPAAHSENEVIRSYPGFFGIANHRIAHELYNLGVKIIPRMISEYAHNATGIDIHPGAQVGESFCIDHGTGIVIGETTTIGDHVKIYQGVTLGALSVDKCDAETKRHPTIQDKVVIYASATILGGNTIIGEGSIVGGNTWVTKSLPPNSKVYYQTNFV